VRLLDPGKVLLRREAQSGISVVERREFHPAVVADRRSTTVQLHPRVAIIIVVVIIVAIIAMASSSFFSFLSFVAIVARGRRG
jgi:hypothetical protein